MGKIGSLFSSTKTFEFYFVRIVLAGICAFCESRLFSAMSRTLNPRIGVMFMIVMISSPGMFHASVAFLPSSFSMYLVMLGTVDFMDWRGGSKTNSAIMYFGVGGIVGWPFASALIAPFIVEEILLASITRDGFEVARRIVDGIVRCMIVLVGNVDIYSTSIWLIRFNRYFSLLSTPFFTTSLSLHHGESFHTTFYRAPDVDLKYLVLNLGTFTSETCCLISTPGSYLP